MNPVASPLHVDVWGSGERVVCVHGSLSWGAFAFRAQRPLAATHSLVVPDRRGYGASATSGPADFETDADDVSALLGEGAHLVWGTPARSTPIRRWATSMPTSTGAARATTRAMPELAERFDGIAVRAPIPVGSIADAHHGRGRHAGQGDGLVRQRMGLHPPDDSGSPQHPLPGAVVSRRVPDVAVATLAKKPLRHRDLHHLGPARAVAARDPSRQEGIDAPARSDGSGCCRSSATGGALSQPTRGGASRWPSDKHRSTSTL